MALGGKLLVLKTESNVVGSGLPLRFPSAAGISEGLAARGAGLLEGHSGRVGEPGPPPPWQLVF